MTRRIGILMMMAAGLATAAVFPRKAPELTINLNGGKKVQVSEHKGKAVVIGFILTGCSHCQATTGILSKLQTEYGPRGLQVLEAAVDQGAEPLVPRFIQSFGPTFPVGYIDYPLAQQFMQFPPMQIMSMPGLVFIDREGNIVKQFTGGDPEMMEGVQEKSLRSQIESMLKPAGAAAPAKKAATPKKAVTKK